MSVWNKKKESEEHEKPFTAASENSNVGGSRLTPESVLEDAIAEKYGKPLSVISSGSSLTGTLIFDTSVRIDGKLSGDVKCSDTVIIGPKGLVDAAIEASTIVVLGRAHGDITATDKVDLLNGGRIEGTIQTPQFQAEAGCIFSGKVTMVVAKIALDADPSDPKAVMN